MTLAIVTVTERFAMLSQDTLVSAVASDPAAELAAVDGRPTRDMGEAIRATFIGDGRAPGEVPIGFVPKFVLMPHVNLAIGGNGDAAFCDTWIPNVHALGYGDDPVEIDRAAPRQLRFLWSVGWSPAPMPTTIYHVGWSNALARPCAFAYSSPDGFESTPIEPNKGHAITPAPWTGHPDYEELHRLWMPAAFGEGTEAFHVALARNQHAAYRAGLFRLGSGIGGQLVTCRVDRAGLHVRVTHEFPEYRHQLAALQRGRSSHSPVEFDRAAPAAPPPPSEA